MTSKQQTKQSSDDQSDRPRKRQKKDSIFESARDDPRSESVPSSSIKQNQQQLYRDVVHSILRFASFGDLRQLVLFNKQWREDIRTMKFGKTRCFTIYWTGSNIWRFDPSLHSLYRTSPILNHIKIVQFASSGLFDDTEESEPLSVHCNCLKMFPSVNTVDDIVVRERGRLRRSGSDSSTPRNPICKFPTTLTNITVKATGRSIQSTLNAIRYSSSLQSLSLAMQIINSRLSPIDYSPLSQLSHLQGLWLCEYRQRNKWISASPSYYFPLLNILRHMSSLRSISIRGEGLDRIENLNELGKAPNQLQRLESLCFKHQVDKQDLADALTQFPGLTCLSVELSVEFLNDLTFLLRFPHLSKLSVEFNIPRSLTTSQVHLIKQMTSLTDLSLYNPDCDPEDWKSLFSHLPLLQSFTLMGASADFNFSCLRPLADQLRCLYVFLTNCDNPSEAELSSFKKLERFHWS